LCDVQVEAGCVTPLAVANASAKHVLLLLDRKIQECGSPVFVHPIVNSASVLISSAGLDAFLKCAQLPHLHLWPAGSSCLLLAFVSLEGVAPCLHSSSSISSQP
jgi:hypothetical protein